MRYKWLALLALVGASIALYFQAINLMTYLLNVALVAAILETAKEIKLS